MGIKKRRLQTLLRHDINLIAYHLPLDVHPTVGNNARLGAILGAENIDAINSVEPVGVLMQGELARPTCILIKLNCVAPQSGTNPI